MMAKVGTSLRATLIAAALLCSPTAIAQDGLANIGKCELPAELWYIVGESNLDPVAALPQFESAFSADSDWDKETKAMMLDYVRRLIKARPEDELAQNRSAVEFLRRAADRGLAEAQYSLALAFRDGAPGIVKNEGSMLHWFERAARQGHGLSMAAFAASKATLAPEEVDFAEVYFWLLLAQANASPQGSKQTEFWRETFPLALSEAEGHLSASERMSVQRRASNWTPEFEVDSCEQTSSG